jgi:hypothetical protein
MTSEDIQKIHGLRQQIIELIKVCDTPQIETILKSADMELHCALWNLGELVSLRPEMDYSD